jgi:hypothetical protein
MGVRLAAKICSWMPLSQRDMKRGVQDEILEVGLDDSRNIALNAGVEVVDVNIDFISPRMKIIACVPRSGEYIRDNRRHELFHIRVVQL